MKKLNKMTVIKSANDGERLIEHVLAGKPNNIK